MRWSLPSRRGELARRLGARVSVIAVQANELILSHSWGADLDGSVAYGSMTVDQVRELLAERVREQELEKTLTRLGDLDQPPVSEICWGDAVAEICRYAKEQEVDLIVMGTHGRSGVTRFVLGSVSERVAGRAHCSVMVAR